MLAAGTWMPQTAALGQSSDKLMRALEATELRLCILTLPTDPLPAFAADWQPVCLPALSLACTQLCTCDAMLRQSHVGT